MIIWWNFRSTFSKALLSFKLHFYWQRDISLERKNAYFEPSQPSGVIDPRRARTIKSYTKSTGEAAWWLISTVCLLWTYLSQIFGIFWLQIFPPFATWTSLQMSSRFGWARELCNNSIHCETATAAEATRIPNKKTYFFKSVTTM